MTDYTFVINVAMRQLTVWHPKKCWKPDCKEKPTFIFEFMDNPFPTCTEHADEFLTILKETARIFRIMKASDTK